MQRRLENLARILCRFPKSVLVFALLLTIVSVYFSLQLKIKSSLTELLPQDAPHVKVLKEATQKSGGIGYLIVAVEGDTLPVLTQFAEDLNAQLVDDPQFRYVYYKNDVNFIKKHALVLLSEDELLKLEKFLSEKIETERAKLNPFFVDLLADLEPPESGEETYSDFDINQLTSQYAFLMREYLTNAEQDFLVLLIKPRKVASDIKATERMVSTLNAKIAALNPAGYGKGLEINLSGRYVSQLKDNKSIGKDLRSTAIISALLIFISLSVMFKKRRTSFIIGLPLLLGMAWTFGMTYLVIGELNLITTFLVAILLGLGINFGIHFFKRYLEFREYMEPEEAIIALYGSSAVLSSITASVTTSVAFFSLILTQFKGFNHFGIIAGLGSLLTLLAYFLVFPPVVLIYERFFPIKTTATHKFPRLHYAERIGRNPEKLKRAFYLIIVVMILCAGLMPQLQFEYDFEKLGTSTQENFDLKKKINGLFTSSLSPAIVLVDSPEESQKTVAAVKAFIKEGSETLADAQDLYSIIPADQDKRIAIIRRIRQLASDKLFDFLNAEEKKIYNELVQYLDVEPATVDMLPNYLTKNFQAIDNPEEMFVLIYPKIELANGRLAQKYAKELKSITVDGKPLVACSETLILADILDLITRDGILAILVTFISLFVILLFQFKRLTTASLVMLPIIIGTFALLGVMGLFGIRFNFINIIAIPIILGIGIDNSVHFYHRYSEDGTLWDAVYHTGMAMFLTTLTTSIGFGSLLFAQHRGLQSLGKVAVLGLMLNLIATFVILPIFLRLGKIWSKTK